MPTTYPGVLDTDNSLWVAKSGAQTQLTVDPGVGGLTINVSSTAGFAPSGYAAIESEVFSYAATSGTTFTGVIRGVDGTTAVAHPSLPQVYGCVAADHHNALKDAVKALEAKVGVNSGGSNASSIDAGQLAAGSSASITALTGSGLITGAGLRDSRGAAGQNMGAVLLGEVNMAGLATVTFNIPNPTVWDYITMKFRNFYNGNTAAVDNINLRINGDATANYAESTWDTVNNATTINIINSGASTSYQWLCVVAGTTVGAGSAGTGEYTLYNLNETSAGKQLIGSTRYGGSVTNQFSIRHGIYFLGNAVVSLTFSTNNGIALTSGKINVYGHY